MGFFDKLSKAFSFGPSADDKRILQTGIQGTAVILGMSEAGMTRKTGGTLPQSLLNIQLQVSLPGSPAYNTTMQKFVSMMEISQLKIGSPYHILADPLDKMKVVFNPNPPANQPVGNTENLITEGYKGTAELKFKMKTSMVKNGYPVWAVQFLITREGIEPYTVDKEVPLPEYEPGRFDVGRKLDCLIDYNDKNKLTMNI